MIGKESILENLRDLRYNHIDDLPRERLILGDENYYKYKCRGNYMTSVRNYICSLISKNMLNEQRTIEEGKKFIDYRAERDQSVLTTKEEIDMVNNVLDKVIKDLEDNL